jgi:hypothetical protein
MVKNIDVESVADDIIASLSQGGVNAGARELLAKTGGRFGSFDAARAYLRRRVKKSGGLPLVAQVNGEPGPNTTFDEDRGKGTGTWNFTGKLDKPMTVDELVAAHGVDLTVWDIDRIKVAKWGVTAKLAARNPDGKIISEKLEAAQNYQIAAWLVRRKESPAVALDDSAERLLSSVRNIVGSKQPFGKLIGSKKHPAFHTGAADPNRMLEVSVFDLHLGKLAWSEETGFGDWDTKIGSSAALEATHDLLNFFPNYGRIWLPLGHDFFNSDGPGENGSSGRTTKGTPQDEDTRWAKSLNTGVDVALAMIEMCKQHAPVDITIMRGNHDEQRCVFLGRLLKEVYRNDPHVTVDAGLGMLKQYQWGDVFLATHHGQMESMQKVVTECAIRFPRFGRAKWREIHSGHGHRMKNAGMVIDGMEEQSVRLRMIPSLTPPDSYHARNLYHNHPCAESYLWHKKDLYEGHHSHNRGTALS